MRRTAALLVTTVVLALGPRGPGVLASKTGVPSTQPSASRPVQVPIPDHFACTVPGDEDSDGENYENVPESQPVDTDASASAPSTSSPASVWRKLSPGDFHASLNAVWGSGPGDVYAVGDGGVVYHTSDGLSWRPQTSGTPWNLYGLSGVSGSRGGDVWAVGAAGTILRTGDGGATWHRVPSGTIQDLCAVWVSPTRDVFVVGGAGTLLRSTAGGAFEALATGTTDDLVGVSGNQKDGLFVVDHRQSEIWQSTDRGASFTHFPVHAGSPFSITALGDGRVYAGGTIAGPDDTNGAAFVWQSRRLPITTVFLQENPVTGIWASGKDVVAVSMGAFIDAKIDSSQDSGATWQGPNETDSSPGLSGVWGSSPSDLYVVGSSIILHSTDGGQTFSDPLEPTFHALAAVWVAGPGDVWAVGDAGVVLHSTDGGAHFQMRTIGGPSAVWTGVAGTGSAIFLAGEAGDSSGAAIPYRSTDGGQTFAPVEEVTDDSARNPRVAASADGKDVYVYGGNISYSHDGGQTFSQWKDPAHDNVAINSLWPAGAREAFGTEEIWSDSGPTYVIVHTTDGGKSWQPTPNPIPADSLTNIFGLDASDVWIGGSGGTVLHSTDHGATWIVDHRRPRGDRTVRSTSPLDVVGLWGTRAAGAAGAPGDGDRDDIYAATAGGVVLHRSPGSSDWTNEQAVAGPVGTECGGLSAISGAGSVGNEEVYAVGPYGTILSRQGSR
jgi:photosystem II stability/assembly factor-like uncharacterized protein